MSKVTSKLQVTIPKSLAVAYGIRPGSEIHWVPAGEGIRVETINRRSLPSLEKRVALFDQMTKRIEKLPPPRTAPHRKDRRWTREDLYADRLDRYARSR